MIYHGMTPNPTLCAGLIMTKGEIRQLTRDKLRPNCHESSAGSFYCIYLHKGNKIHIGTYKSLDECNDAWDKEHAKRGEKKTRKPVGKGYTSRVLAGGRMSYNPSISYNGANEFLGTVYTEEEARAMHLEAIDRVNNGTYENWSKRRAKVSKN